jgi:hypothetical protein
MYILLRIFTFGIAARILDVSRTVDSDGTDGAETNAFNKSHFNRLKKRGIIKSTTPSIIAGTLDTPRTDGTDGTETNVFNESHFHQLREQGVIDTESFSQDGVLELDQCRDYAGGNAIPPRLGIH